MTSKSSVPKNHHVQLEVPITQKNRGPHYTRIHADKNDPTLHITTKVKNHQQPLFFNSLGSCKCREQSRVKDIEWSKSSANLQQNIQEGTLCYWSPPQTCI